MNRSNPEGKIERSIVLKNVSFTYESSDSRSLNDISFSFIAGKFYMIMGATGSGKTSLVRLFNRIIPRFFKGLLTGRIELLSASLTHQTPSELAGTVGMVFQEFESQLFSTDVRHDLVFGPENLAVQPELIMSRLQQITVDLELTDLLNRDPAELSGGQKQRLAIACMLMLDPTIIILDEPTTDLDPEGQQEIYELLDRLTRTGKTVLMIDHSADYAFHADELIIMHDGNIKTSGPPNEVLKNLALLRECKIQIPQIYEVLLHFGADLPENDASHAAAYLRSRGIKPDLKKYAELVNSENQRQSDQIVLELENVCFSYDDNQILDNVNLKIFENDFLCLIGKNGSGKTTLAKLLIGLLKPSPGKVFIRGKLLEDWSTEQLANEIGYVFQNPDYQIFCSTVREELAFGLENIGMPKIEMHERIADALQIVGLEGKEEMDPFSMPKGDRQRVAVASILVMAPRIIILDEPTTGLDHPDQIRMMELIARLHKSGRTIVMITHSMTIALKYANRAIAISDKTVFADMPIRNFFKDDRLLEKTNIVAPPIVHLSKSFDVITRDASEFISICESAAT